MKTPKIADVTLANEIYNFVKLYLTASILCASAESDWFAVPIFH